MQSEARRQLETDCIGTAFYNPGQFISLKRAVSPELFADPFHQKVVQGMHACIDGAYELTPLNIATIAKLTAQESAMLVEIGERSGNLRLLSRKLAEYAIHERFQEFRGHITEEADVFELLKQLHKLEGESASIISANTQPDKLTILTGYSDYLLTNNSNGVNRISTGFPKLDRMLSGGLTLGDLSLIGGLPGSGKTSFMLCIALNAARLGFKVAFLEGEMTMNEVHERLNGIWTGTDIDRIRRGNEYDSLSKQFISDVYDLPLVLVPSYERTVESLTAQIQNAVCEGASLIIVDYLQVFAPKGRSEDEFSNIKALSETLRKLAIQNNVHISVASSLNRNEMGGKLSLHSLYGSAQLGHDCAVGLLLEGEQQDLQELKTRERTVKLNVVKNRSGARGTITLKFHLSSQRIEEQFAAPMQNVDVVGVSAEDIEDDGSPSTHGHRLDSTEITARNP